MLNYTNRFIYLPCLLVFLTVSSVKSQAFLNYFTGTAAQDKVILEWQMLLGSTCDGIRILHSTDSLIFDEIGLIGGICGSKTESVKYEFIHKTAAINKINYYQLEFGNTFFSNVIQIELIAYDNGYQIRPHPIINTGKILFNGDGQTYHLELINTSGRVISRTESISSEFEIQTGNLSDQLLFFRILTEKGAVHAQGKLLAF